MKIFKIIFKTFLIFICLLIIWLIGLLVQLPLIPLIETDYFVNGTKINLVNGLILKQINNTILKIEIPKEFNEYNQCFDFWFTSTKGSYLLSVNKFTQELISKDNSIIKSQNSYLFWENGSLENTNSINNHNITYSYLYEQKKYVFFRTVFNLNDFNEFAIKLKVNFYINNNPNFIDTTLNLVKKNKLTWNKFRVH